MTLAGPRLDRALSSWDGQFSTAWVCVPIIFYRLVYIFLKKGMSLGSGSGLNMFNSMLRNHFWCCPDDHISAKNWTAVSHMQSKYINPYSITPDFFFWSYLFVSPSMVSLIISSWKSSDLLFWYIFMIALSFSLFFSLSFFYIVHILMFILSFFHFYFMVQFYIFRCLFNILMVYFHILFLYFKCLKNKIKDVSAGIVSSVF